MTCVLLDRIDVGCSRDEIDPEDFMITTGSKDADNNGLNVKKAEAIFR